MDALRQLGTSQRLAHSVVADVSDLAQTVEQAERLKDAGIDANADIGISGLDLLEGGAGGEGTLRHNRHWQPSTPTGIMDIGT
jgi:hypothetical protein